MPTPREIADLACKLAQEHIDRSRVEIENASDGDWMLLSDAIKLVHDSGPSSAEHVAYTLLHEAMTDIRRNR